MYLKNVFIGNILPQPLPKIEKTDHINFILKYEHNYESIKCMTCDYADTIK